MQLIFIALWSLFLNGINLSSIIFLIINTGVFLVILFLNTGIYLVGFGQKEVNFEKTNIIEIVSGIFLAFQIVVIFMGRF